MLQIKNIKKVYKTGDLVQKALDDVSLNLRDNEFVAILGPSGSGKTTLLNIIGGLDHYDEGDLIINSVSTKKYKDRDWDSYRNHTIGFVFQSYNLISHQTVLKNVELALTISGVPKKERTKKALQALEEVGLKEQAHKKPNQMSGGQMQRVAIARALVNDPDILLADEPTGALDSKTSYQVMDLLKKVAKDRLVVMVSHNPELAKEYATRIVNIKDGKIIGDSDPFIIEEEKPVTHRNLGKAKMNLSTALSLSFNNLLSKKGRTILTAFAGSIGIIGIALILSLSQGFQNYVDKIQEDTMASYPLTIQSDTNNFFGSMMGKKLESDDKIEDGYVKEIPIITSITNSFGSNDIKSFKEWLENNENLHHDIVTKIEYSYSVSPLIYTRDVNNKIVQLNPSTIMSTIYSDAVVSMISSMSASNGMGSSFMKADFDEIEKGKTLLAGEYPHNYDEVLMVLNSKDMISDLFVYSLGLRDINELQKIIQQIMNGEDVTIRNKQMVISYDELMDIELKLIDANKLYKYNSDYNTYEDMSKDEIHMQKVYDESTQLKITGIALSDDDSSGILYSDELIYRIIEDAEKSVIVQKQLANKNIDIFSNTEFGDDSEGNDIDFNDLVSIDENLLKEAFKVNISENDFKFDTISEEQLQKIIFDNASKTVDSITSGPSVNDMVSIFTIINTGMLQNYISSYEKDNITEVDKENGVVTLSLDNVDTFSLNIDKNNYKNTLNYMLEISPETSQYKELLQVLQDSDYENLSSSVREMFLNYYDEVKNISFNNKVIYESYTKDSLPDSSKDMFKDYLDQINDKQTFVIYKNPNDLTNPIVSLKLLSDVMGNEKAIAYTTSAINNIINNYTFYVVAASIGSSVQAVMEPTLSSLSGLQDVFSKDIMTVDADKFKKAFNFNMNEDELSRLMSSMMQRTNASYNNNLISLGYQDIEEPSSMSIYFNGFDAKSDFLDLIDKYNDSVTEEKQISYTDMTGLLMSSVQTVISSVTYVLIAFVSISLIVSSIMIAVITLISVMERTKEIGILRAMGASKNNVSSIFNAETFIIGLLSGSLGILVTYLLLLPINSVIHSVNADITAVLNPIPALILICISVVLTLISGLIPSRKAAKQDPVNALRSE